MTRVNNGLGVLAIVTVMAVTPLVPQVAMSGQTPQWKWNADGTVYDASGQFRAMSEEEVCQEFGWGCRRITTMLTTTLESDATDGGGSC